MHSHTRSDYVLGYSETEHARLVRQGGLLELPTERLLQAAGIAPGMAVLDIGCGVGDVSLLAARMVGPSGRVVGLDRDRLALAIANERALQADCGHASFEHGAFETVEFESPFDAVIGRFALMFAPDPALALGNLLKSLRTGGLVVLQEPSWKLFFSLAEETPLRSACGRWICDAFRKADARPDMGLALISLFETLRLSKPAVLIEVPVVANTEEARWIVDLMETLLHEAGDPDLSEHVGTDFASLPLALEVEAARAGLCQPQVGLVGVWARKI